MTETTATVSAKTDPRHLYARVLGAVAAGFLLASLLLPYWQVRLFAPQYRQGLTATMYAYKLTGDVQEINGLNHYVGVPHLDSLAVWERRAALPGIIVMALLCLFAFPRACRLTRLAYALPATLFPLVFVADMAFWMHRAATHLDPMAPLKLKPFSIPIMGTGKVGQFRSEVAPHWGFLLAVIAALLMLCALWLAWRHDNCPNVSPKDQCRFHNYCPLERLALLAILLALPSSARAGDIQKLISDALPGAVVELPPGTYGGPLLVDKPLTLRGGGRAVIDGRGNGTLITVRAPGVALEGLVLRGSGDSLLYEDSGVRLEAPSASVRDCRFEDVLFGVFLVHAPGAVIEGNRFKGKPLDMGRRGDLIRSWNSDKILVRGNVLEGGRDFVLWFSTGSRVEGNTIADGRYGLHFMYTNNAQVERNRFIANSVGFYIMYSQRVGIRGNRFERHRGPSGSGLGLKESDWITVEDNDFTVNRQAVYIDGSPLLAENTNLFARNVFARNDIGLSVLPGVSGNVIYDNVFDDNLQQVSRRGGGQMTGNEWSKNGRGNFWSDYAGYGRAGAETGMIPYRVESAWEGLMDRQPLARFFFFTPAAQAVELASRAFPVFRPKAVLTDERPLLRPPVGIERSQEPIEAAWSLPAGLAAFSGFLLGLPGLLRRRRGAPGAPPAGDAPALSLEGLKKGFGGRPILCDVAARLGAGRTLVLWGANGAGKSTLIKCLLGLHDYEGTIRIFGHDARSAGPDARARLGYVAQEFAGYDWTVRQAMEFIADLRGVEREKITAALARCGLHTQEDKRVCDLSGGMKQKLALSQALLPDPPLLVLDEPCSNLDAASRADLLHILQGLKGGRAIVMTSHRAEEVELLADEVLWLEEGKPARLLSRADFAREAASLRPLWVELEAPDLRAEAVSALARGGYSAKLNGTGIWVDAPHGRTMDVARFLEAGGFKVRDLRREAAS